MGTISEIFRTDYRFRATVNKSDFASALGQLVLGIGYGNFKREVSAVQGHARASVYGKVWTQLYQLQIEPNEYEWDSRSAIEKMAVNAANSYGAVLISPEGQTLLRRVSAGFDGYKWTFAKGRPDGFETPQETAKREVLEETGYHCHLIGHLTGRYQGGTGYTVYFVAAPVGNQQLFGSETAETRWVSFEEAHALLMHTTNVVGRERDQAVLNDLYRWCGARDNSYPF